MPISTFRALDQINHSKGAIEIDQSGQLSKASFLSRVWYALNPKANDQRVAKLLDYVNRHWSKQKATPELIGLSRQVIKLGDRSKNHDLLARLGTLDAMVFRADKSSPLEDRHFVSSKQEKLYQKWLAQGFPASVFVDHPDFVKFVMASHINSCMALYDNDLNDHTVKMDAEGKPLLRINGAYRQWSDFADRFEVRKSKLFDEEMIFEKGTDKVWTYLGGEKGLVEYNPFTFDHLETIHKIGQEDVAALQRMGHAFVRSGESAQEREAKKDSRQYVLQVVSSNIATDKDGNELYSGYLNTFGKPKHPWFRLVSPDGDIKVVGYGWEKEMMLPAQTVRGRFRGPDIWEFKKADRVVTNIAISAEEAEKMEAYVMKYQKKVFHNQPEDQRDSNEVLGFNLLRHNCSVFTIRALGEVLGIRPDIEVTFAKMMHDLLPVRLQAPGTALAELASRKWNELRQNARKNLSPAFYSGLKAVCRAAVAVFNGIRAFFVAPLVLLAGGWKGKPRRSFEGAGQMDNGNRLVSIMAAPEGWFTLSGSSLFLPSRLQAWQKSQPDATQHIPAQPGMGILNRV